MLCLTRRSSSSPLMRGHTERKRCCDCCDFEPDCGADILTATGTVGLSCLGTAVGTDRRDEGRCKWRSRAKSGKSGMRKSGMRMARCAAVGRMMRTPMMAAASLLVNICSAQKTRKYEICLFDSKSKRRSVSSGFLRRSSQVFRVFQIELSLVGFRSAADF